MRGQFGLRPPARQNGRLPTLFFPLFGYTLPHRPGDLILGNLHMAAAADTLLVESPR